MNRKEEGKQVKIGVVRYACMEKTLFVITEVQKLFWCFKIGRGAGGGRGKFVND